MGEARTKTNPTGENTVMSNLTRILLGYRDNGLPIWQIAGGSEPGVEPPNNEQQQSKADAQQQQSTTPPQTPPQTPPPAKATTNGYPAETPVSEMTAEQQVAYWKAQSRKHEDTVKGYGGITAEQAKALAKDEDKRRREAMNEQERLVAAAADKARAEANAEWAPRVVAAEFRAAAAGRLTPEQLSALTEDMDPLRYLTDKGEVDVARVARKVDALAPVKEPERRFPDLGQGHREQSPTAGLSAGAARYAAQHKK